jgi:hypothetical protein
MILVIYKAISKTNRTVSTGDTVNVLSVNKIFSKAAIRRISNYRFSDAFITYST